MDLRKCFWNGELYKDQRFYECHGNLFKGMPGYMQKKKLLVRAKSMTFTQVKDG